MTPVNLPRPQNRVRFRPVLVWRVGEFLRFEADGGPLLIDYPTLPDNRAVQEVAGIDLQARFGGVNL